MYRSKMHAQLFSRYYALQSLFLLFLVTKLFLASVSLTVSNAALTSAHCYRKLSELTTTAPHQAHQPPPARFQP
jgi:hypothetical protein